MALAVDWPRVGGGGRSVGPRVDTWEVRAGAYIRPSHRLRRDGGSLEALEAVSKESRGVVTSPPRHSVDAKVHQMFEEIFPIAVPEPEGCLLVFVEAY